MRTAVIGGGAAGLASAVFAARAGSSVTVFEGNDRVGRKLLSTGNGRCNLSNADISPARYATAYPPFLETALEGRGFGFAREFFASLGVPLTVEEGRAYPRSMRAAAVADALRFECLRLGAELRTGVRVNGAEAVKGRFMVEDEMFDRLILACGGMAAPALGSDGFGFRLAKGFGHRVLEPYPALVQLRALSPDKSLKGVRAEARVTAIVGGRRVREERGEVQFTDYGLSGVPIMQLSTLFRGEMEVVIDLLPEWDFTSLTEELSALAEHLGDLPPAEFMGGYLHKSLTRRACLNAGLDPSRPVGALTLRELKALVGAFKNMSFKIVGTNSWPQAQTTRGGVDLREIEPKTMESRLVRGLYFAGEITDVCGDCGGYNLHWAWVSGAAAGESAAH